MSDRSGSLLGAYLKHRRSKLDPGGLGFSASRRRTPGLRREEVAQRANVSVTWYTWLEQGRGGAPSADVLDRLAWALMLTGVEREHLFLLGLGRLPEVRYQAVAGVTPRLQRVLDSLELSPALVKTKTWDVIAWNRAAAVVLTDYGALEPAQRNILRLIFSDPRAREAQLDWKEVARFVVATFRADATRAGATADMQALADELCRTSPDFNAMWLDYDVGHHGEGTKHLRHPTAGLLALEFSAFSVNGRSDLDVVIYNPASEADAEQIKVLMDAAPISRLSPPPQHTAA